MRIYKCNKNQRERRDSDLIGNMDTLKCVTAGGMAAEGWYRVYEATVAISSISGFGSGGDNGIIFISTNYNYSSPMSCILSYTVGYGGVIHWNCISSASNGNVRVIDKIRFSLIPGSKISIDIHYRTSNNNNFEIRLLSNRFGKKFRPLENAQPITDNPLTISEYDIPEASDFESPHMFRSYNISKNNTFDFDDWNLKLGMYKISSDSVTVLNGPPGVNMGYGYILVFNRYGTDTRTIIALPYISWGMYIKTGSTNSWSLNKWKKVNLTEVT